MNIFVTNDDGVHASGLAHLISIAKKFGKVFVVVPDKPQSGMSHAITLSRPLRLHKVKEDEDSVIYVCDGTPVDCVKLGLKVGLNNIKPDLLLSGINHGSNASSNVIYSGTMGAAIEGALEKIPSIGFSLIDFSQGADFEASTPFLEEIIQKMIELPQEKAMCLNVNIPKLKREEIKGTKVCVQADTFWEEDFETREDPYNHKYYWLTGSFHPKNLGEDTDLWALKNGYISIVPIQFDWTDYKNIEKLSGVF